MATVFYQMQYAEYYVNSSEITILKWKKKNVEDHQQIWSEDAILQTIFDEYDFLSNKQIVEMSNVSNKQFLNA